MRSLILVFADVTISFEQEVYTVIESEGPVIVCTDITDGQLARRAEFIINVFQVSESAEGESKIHRLSSLQKV